MIADRESAALSPREAAVGLTRLRREWRLLLPTRRLEEVEAELDARLERRAFAGGDTTRIVTTYLDRADGALAGRYRAGRGSRLHVRLKSYVAADGSGRWPGRLALELKRQRAGVTRKARVWIPAGALAQALSDPFHPLVTPLRLWRLGGRLEPVGVVGYLRVVWEDRGGALRITLDRELGAAPPPAGLLAMLADGRQPRVTPAVGAPAVLEVKHRGTPPELAWLIGAARPASFSKLAWVLGASPLEAGSD